jgi:hypothetical protein
MIPALTDNAGPRRRKMKKRVIVAVAVLLGWAAGATPRGQALDPMVFATAVADQELFGTVYQDPTAKPRIKVHHDHNWLDGTLMSGVAALTDRLDAKNRDTPR